MLVRGWTETLQPLLPPVAGADAGEFGLIAR